MKTQLSSLFVGALPLLAVCPAADANVYPNPLASTTVAMSGSSTVTANTFQFRLGNAFGFGINSPIFDTLTLSVGDIGKVFPITQAQDADFNSLVALLVNGQSDSLAFEFSFDHFQTVAGNGNQENLFFAPLPPGNNGIDFQGFPIDNIALRLDSADIGGSSYSVQTTIFVNSAAVVPEPSTAGLLALGGILGTVVIRTKAR